MSFVCIRYTVETKTIYTYKRLHVLDTQSKKNTPIRPTNVYMKIRTHDSRFSRQLR